MTRQDHGLVLGLGALLAALAACAVLPLIDPRCSGGSPGAALLGSCGGNSGGLARDLMMIGSLTVAAALAVVGAAITLQAIAHHQLAEMLRRVARPAVVADQAVGLVPGVGAAVVAGLRSPRIYCTEDAINILTDEELAAVLLHERHHALAHAPARLVVLAGLGRTLGRTRAGAAWIEAQRSRIEIAADAHAIACGATRPALARAILKLAVASPTLTLAGFASATELRIRALLDEAPGGSSPARQRLPMTILGTVVVAVACAILSMA